MSILQDFDPVAFVRAEIAKLRTELLDFSTRNKLLSFKHSDRGSDYIRAVDELPAEMFRHLSGGGMRFKPLPHITDAPADEATEEFKCALEEARQTDGAYLEAVKKLIEDGLQPDHDFWLERRLRDTVRVFLGKNPIIVRANRVDLAAFAVANGINPEYQLPYPVSAARNDHRDKFIQTLFLPDDLDRRVRKIYESYQDHIQEKGINVLNAAFGFLEWYEDDTSSTAHYAPLILAPLTLTRSTDRGQIGYTISAETDEAQVNVTLQEFLKQKHQLTLPAFLPTSEQDQSGETAQDEAALLEPWLARVAEVIASKRRWRVCRFVTIATFPFSRIALYKDLATEDWAGDALSKHEVVGRLLGGRGSTDADATTNGGGDYPIDDPSFPLSVPCLVLEADSSQHSAVIDAIAGKSFVIQGPPGTGKSQTIANIIAAALDANKRVLFMAEKNAALNVVSSRLKDRGLGPFLFEVHSDRTRKSDILTSISERLKLEALHAPEAVERKLEQRRTLQDKLARYVALMGKPIGKLARPLHQLMWFSNRYAPDLDQQLPAGFEKIRISHALSIDSRTLDRYRASLDGLAKARSAILSTAQRLAAHPWRGIGQTNRFLANQIVEAANAVDHEVQRLIHAVATLRGAGFNVPDDEGGLRDWVDAVSRMPALTADPQLLSLCLQAKDYLTTLADYVERHLKLCGVFAELFVDHRSLDANALNELLVSCQSLKTDASVSALTAAYTQTQEEQQVLEHTVNDLKQLVDFLGTPWPASPSDALSLVQAAKLFVEEREEVLDARTHGMLADGSERLIAVAGRKAILLAGRETSLNEQFDVPRARREFSSEALYRAADTLAASNILTAFSSEARQANTMWRCLVRNPLKANAQIRSEHLKEVACLLVDTNEFANDPKNREVLGLDFQGHQSDFDLYRAASDLLRSAALAMARSSAPFRSAAYQKLVGESTHNLRLLRARFSAGDLASLEHRLLAYVSVDEELVVMLDRVRQRRLAIASALETARSILTEEASLTTDRSPDGEWKLTKDLMEWRRRERELQERADVRNALGSTYDAILGDPAVLRTALAEAQALESADLPSVMAREIKTSVNPPHYRETAERAAHQLAAIVADFRERWDHFAATARMSETDFFGNAGESHSIPLDAAHARLQRAVQNAGSLLDWMPYKYALDEALSTPTAPIAKAFDALEVNEERLADIFELCLVQTLIRHQLETEGRELADLTGTTLDDARARFAALDKELLDLEAMRLVSKAALQKAPYGNDQGPRSTWSECALLENEAKKRKRHIPLRDVIRRAPNALRALKPVWMMSPLTAAQYLPRLDAFFDIVIIDEASQMKPADAIGGLARAPQAIVVGDPMQLPPTDFFATSLDGADGQDGVAAGQSSILDLAETRLRRTRMLRWHYRSRHESLIAFSNKHFYDDRLVVFPSATDSYDDLGLEHVYVGGQYLGGGTNSEEARVIVERARELIERDPNLSIGLVTTNTQQRELVLEELEKLAHENRSVADYRARWQETLEPLFVKNLENVQGDERDVILISTVFGPGETGQVAQRFGPINSEAGHRRLNVLFTRAKQKIVLVTSMRSGDIVAGPSANRGVHILKSFLEYVSVGRIEPGIETGRPPDSDFEIHVANRLRLAGYEAVPQVGVNGFRIDIGVRHPGWPNGFLAGIECDGATYHSGVTVRDRDRLRQEILEGLGWRLYRVWSTDWFTNQDREMAKMLAWLEAVRNAGG